MIRTVVVTIYDDDENYKGKCLVQNVILKTDAPDTINRNLKEYIKAAIKQFVDDVSEDDNYFR